MSPPRVTVSVSLLTDQPKPACENRHSRDPRVRSSVWSAWLIRLRRTGSRKPCRWPKPAADAPSLGKDILCNPPLCTASCASGPRLGRSPRATSEEVGIHLPQQTGEPVRCSASEEADGPRLHAGHSPKADHLAPDAVIVKSFRGNSNLLEERPPSVNPGGLGDGLPLRRARIICRAGAASSPLNSEELCNYAGTNPDAGLPFRRCTPRGSLALPGPESRYGSRSTREVPKNPL